MDDVALFQSLTHNQSFSPKINIMLFISTLLVAFKY